MGSLERVAVNDITKFKNNSINQDELNTTELKKKLMETIETSQLLQMLEATKKTDKSPIEAMNELGFNMKDITGGLKDNVELYKNLVEMEVQKRSEIEQREHETRGQVIELKEKLVESTIMNQMERYHQAVNDLAKKLEEKDGKKKDDPMQDAVSNLTLKLLNDKIEDLTEKKQYNPMQDIFNALETYEQLKSKFKSPEPEIQTDPNRINLELVKLKLEDDRERALEEKKIQIDKEKQETIKYALNTIGAEIADAIGSLASAFSQSKQGAIQPDYQPQHQAQGIQGIPYQCEECKEIFIISRAMDNATCPYCGHRG